MNLGIKKKNLFNRIDLAIKHVIHSRKYIYTSFLINPNLFINLVISGVPYREGQICGSESSQGLEIF